jgi:hypothetical protein
MTFSVIRIAIHVNKRILAVVVENHIAIMVEQLIER